MTTSTDTTATSKPRFSRRARWIAGGSLAALLIAAGITVPFVIAHKEHQDAYTAYQSQVDAADTATAEANDAAAALTAATSGAAEEADQLQALVDAVPAELVDPASAREDLAAAITGLRGTVTNVSTPRDVDKPGSWSELSEKATTSELVDATSEGLKFTTAAMLAASSSEGAATILNESLDIAHKAVDALVTAAATKGAASGYDHAGDAERQALTDAVAALSGQPAGADRPALADTATHLTSYVAAAGAAKASHDAAVAAAAAAEEAARNAAGNANGNGSTSRTGTGGGRGGSSNGSGSTGGGSTGGGSNGSGSTGGGGGSTGGSGSTGGGSGTPTCWGNQENACVKTPPTFSTNSYFVPLNGGCAFYTTHNVGYGGNSRNSYSFPWSATVSGPTVTYYVCG